MIEKRAVLCMLRQPSFSIHSDHFFYPPSAHACNAQDVNRTIAGVRKRRSYQSEREGEQACDRLCILTDFGTKGCTNPPFYDIVKN